MKKVNGITIYDEGNPSGLPVIFIHAFPVDHSMWRPQVEMLSPSYRVISYDVRGHGQSEVGDGQYTMELFVDDLLAVADHLRVQTSVLCGLSMGGYIVLRAAERHPDRWKGIVLCDTKSEADGNEAKIKRAAAIASVKKIGAEGFAKTFIKTVLAESTLKNKFHLVESVLKMVSQNSTTGIAGALLALASRTDTTPFLPKLTVPTLILVGEEDKVTPPAASELMQKAIPSSQMHVISDAAHFSNLENPTAFNAKLLTFLKAIHS